MRPTLIISHLLVSCIYLCKLGNLSWLGHIVVVVDLPGTACSFFLVVLLLSCCQCVVCAFCWQCPAVSVAIVVLFVVCYSSTVTDAPSSRLREDANKI